MTEIVTKIKYFIWGGYQEGLTAVLSVKMQDPKFHLKLKIN